MVMSCLSAESVPWFYTLNTDFLLILYKILYGLCDAIVMCDWLYFQMIYWLIIHFVCYTVMFLIIISNKMWFVIYGVMFCVSWFTLLVLKPEYSGITRSIPCLLMAWLLVSPGQQQSWFWWYRIKGPLSLMRKNFNYLCHLSIEKWKKIQIYFLCFLKNNFNLTRVNICGCLVRDTKRPFYLSIKSDIQKNTNTILN